MKKIKISEIVSCTKVVCTKNILDEEIDKISIDTRNINIGDLFIAIKGENFDGHDFVNNAFEKGCKVAIVDREIEGADDKALIVVEDTLEALQDIARYYLSLFDVKVVAVTGSTGKTSTKELIVAVLEEQFKVAKNIGNFNNHIGLPLSVFNIEDYHEVAVFELGMNNLMEIDLLASIVKPDIAVITNVGLSHIENLGSQENILKAKMEITNYFTKDNTLIVNNDNEMLSTVKNLDNSTQLITVGKEKNSDYAIGEIKNLGINGITFDLTYSKSILNIKLPLIGEHNAYNASLAIAVGLKLNMKIEDAIKGAENHFGEKMRLTVEKGERGIVVLNDVYNASPDSMMAAIDSLVNIQGGRKVVILSDMLEMGSYSEKYHKKIGKYSATQGVDVIISVGNDAKYIIDGAKEHIEEKSLKYFKNNEELIEEIDNIICENDVILVKGSRGMKMEKIVEHILRGAVN